jgi:hypothetical protein
MACKEVKLTLKTSTVVLCSVLLGITAGCAGSASSLTSGSPPASAVGTSTSGTSTSGTSTSGTSTSGTSTSGTSTSGTSTSGTSTSGTSTSGTSGSTAPSGSTGSTSLSITGLPPKAVQAGQAYSFTPSVQNSTGRALSFSIANKPNWATFSATNGSLSGSPSASNVGTDSNIMITVSTDQQSATLSPFAISVSAPGSSSSSNGGAIMQFSFPNFSSQPNTLYVGNTDASAYNGNAVDVTNGSIGEHEAGAVWYTGKQDITSFTTDFTFRITATGYGMCFVIQNDPRGLSAAADANGIGYFQYASNQADTAVENSIAIAFNASPNTNTSGGTYIGATPSVTGLYIDGGPYIANGGIFPVQDMSPQGINLQSGDLMAAHVVYDGAILSLSLTDEATGAQAYLSWPVNISAIVGADTAYVGFGAGTIPAVTETLNSWTWWHGYYPRLASPTFSPTAGSYTSPQSVTINGPADATIYYTTNGKPPTTASSVYSGPITVGSNELVQAIAVAPNYTQSLPAQANYQVQSASSPLINFAGGFANANGLVQTNGVALINGSNLQLTDGATPVEIGSAFYSAPVNIQAFTTKFTLTFSGGLGHNSLLFVIQNQLSPSNDTAGDLVGGPQPASGVVSGGPYSLGYPTTDQTTPDGGYAGIGQSVAVKFDFWNNSTGLFTNGETPYTPQTTITGITLGSDPVSCTLTYDGTTLSLSMEDTVTGQTFTNTWRVNIPATVGADTAYIGFTAGFMDGSSIQDVAAWTYSN